MAEFRWVNERSEAEWRKRVDGAEQSVIWAGFGNTPKAVAFLTSVGREAGVELAVDVNPHKQDKFLAGSGVEVVAPERLRDERPDLVVAMNPVYLEEIGGARSELGVEVRLEAV